MSTDTRQAIVVVLLGAMICTSIVGVVYLNFMWHRWNVDHNVPFYAYPVPCYVLPKTGEVIVPKRGPQ